MSTAVSSACLLFPLLMSSENHPTLCLFGAVNQDTRLQSRAPCHVDNPRQFYEDICNNYFFPPANPEDLCHFLDCVPKNDSCYYRRLWFDLDFHSKKLEEVDVFDNKDEIMEKFIIDLVFFCRKFYDVRKDLKIIVTRKEIGLKKYSNTEEYSAGYHVYTNMFVLGKYLPTLYKMMCKNNELLLDIKDLGINTPFETFVDKSVIGNPKQNNGCMFLGCTKNNVPSTYYLYLSFEFGEWRDIDTINGNDELKKLFYGTLLNYPDDDRDQFCEWSNPELFDNIMKNCHTNRYVDRLSNASEDTLKSASDMKGVKAKSMELTVAQMDDIYLPKLVLYYEALATINKGALFDQHDTWFKICAATKQIYNEKSALDLFYHYSNEKGHHRDLAYFNETWNNMKCDEYIHSNYILTTLLKYNLIDPSEKNDYTFMLLLNSWKGNGTIDSSTIVNLFHLYYFNDIYAVYTNLSDFTLYKYDEYNVLRKVDEYYDLRYFERAFTSFICEILKIFRSSQLYKEDEDYIKDIENKIKQASVKNRKNFKEWRETYLTLFGIPYATFINKYMVMEELHIYTQVGCICPYPVDKVICGDTFSIQKYEKEDMIFEELLLGAKYIENWSDDEMGKQVVEQFNTHIMRYCGFSTQYAELMKSILTSAFYINTQNKIAYILYGPTGANGKTVTIDLLAAIVGKNQCVVVNPDNLDENSISPKLVDMSNKCMYYMNELVDEDTSGKKRTYNPFQSRIFKEIAEKKSGSTARQLYSNVYANINYTGILFITSNVQPTAINASPIARRVCFLPSCCRFFPPGSKQLYEYQVDESLPPKKQEKVLVLKPNHYEMDPTIPELFRKYKDYIFSYLVQNYFFKSRCISLKVLEEEEHIAACKTKFFNKATEGYDIKDFVEKYINIDPYNANVVTIEEIFAFYKKINEKNNYTIKKDLEKFTNAFFGCLTSIDKFNKIDIVNVDRCYEASYYKSGTAHGIRGIMINKTFSHSLDPDIFCLERAISKVGPVCETTYDPYAKPIKRYIIGDHYYYNLDDN